VVRVEDLSEHHGNRTVTNAAEDVVALVVHWWPRIGLDGLPIVYRDSEGRWDQLRVERRRPYGTVFAGFGALGARTEDEAVAAVRAAK
jgi:hypothetical protein